jgi:hypothetical protein
MIIFQFKKPFPSPATPNKTMISRRLSRPSFLESVAELMSLKWCVHIWHMRHASSPYVYSKKKNSGQWVKSAAGLVGHETLTQSPHYREGTRASLEKPRVWSLLLLQMGGEETTVPPSPRRPKLVMSPCLRPYIFPGNLPFLRGPLEFCFPLCQG